MMARLWPALGLAMLLLSSPVVAMPTTSFELAGAVDRPGTYARADLQALPAQTAAVTFQTGRAGIVYATDAAASAGVAVAGVFPDGTHERVTYPFAVVQASDTPETRALLQFLSGPDARAIFKRRGFTAAE